MTLEQRLEKLERVNRWMRRIGAVAAAVAAAVFLVGQGKDLPRTVRAQRFVLVDDERRERGGLWITDGNDVALELGTNTGHARLKVTPEGHASLDLGLGKHRMVLRVKEFGKAGIYITTHDGIERTSLEVDAKKARLQLAGNGSSVAVKGDGHFWIDGGSGHLGLSVDPRWASVESHHKKGQAGLRLESRPDGRAWLSLWDTTKRGGFFTRRDYADDQSLRVALGSETPGRGYLRFLKDAGTVIWQAPR